MTDIVREKLEAAYRKLPILPEREARLADLVSSIEPGVEKAEVRPKRIRKKGVDKVKEDLTKLSLLARCLTDELETMHHSTKLALLTHKFGGKGKVEKLIADLDNLYDAAQDAAEDNLSFEASQKPPKRSVLIATLLHFHYELLTGQEPPHTRTSNGHFYALVADVLGILGIEGSVENAVRDAFKSGS